MTNPMLDECATHLARDYHDQTMRLVGKLRLPAPLGVPIRWEDTGYEARTLAVQTMRSLLYRGVILCPRPEHRIGLDLRAERLARAAKTKPCLHCGVWTCGGCGWRRTGANLMHPEAQDCKQCGGTEGELRPTRHGHDRWMRCHNDGLMQAGIAERDWEAAPSA